MAFLNRRDFFLYGNSTVYDLFYAESVLHVTLYEPHFWLVDCSCAYPIYSGSHVIQMFTQPETRVLSFQESTFTT
jgi:hypothetical protein